MPNPACAVSLTQCVPSHVCQTSAPDLSMPPVRYILPLNTAQEWPPRFEKGACKVTGRQFFPSSDLHTSLKSIRSPLRFIVIPPISQSAFLKTARLWPILPLKGAFFLTQIQLTPSLLDQMSSRNFSPSHPPVIQRLFLKTAVLWPERPGNAAAAAACLHSIEPAPGIWIMGITRPCCLHVKMQ